MGARKCDCWHCRDASRVISSPFDYARSRDPHGDSAAVTHPTLYTYTINPAADFDFLTKHFARRLKLLHPPGKVQGDRDKVDSFRRIFEGPSTVDL